MLDFFLSYDTTIILKLPAFLVLTVYILSYVVMDIII